MSRELKILVLGSVLTCLMAFGMLLSGPVVVATSAYEAAPELWQMPGAGVPRDGKEPLLEGNALKAFSPKIFESLQLKGFVRGKNGVWSGVFQAPDGRPLILSPGMTREGITLVFADGRNAQIRYGALLRDFSLNKPQQGDSR